MKNPASIPFWSTASFGEAADTSPMELSALGEHLGHCNGCRGRMFNLRRIGEAVHGFVASRFVTTLVVATLMLGGAFLLV